MYARATKAVSLVPPAYYADIACERARDYLSTLMNVGDAGSTSSRGNNNAEAVRQARERVYQKAVEQWGNGIHRDLRDSMFYI
jgi:eukaryotic translation initiation factor 2C